MRPALEKLQSANIAPVDLAQSAIGPGIGVFSRYKSVLEADGKPMSVRAALQIINQEAHPKCELPRMPTTVLVVSDSTS